MTLFDRLFLAMAIIDVLALIAMGWIGLRMLETLKRAQREANPALREGKALAVLARTVLTEARESATTVTSRVKALAEKVKHRVATTRRIAGEIVPHGRESASMARETGADLAGKARTMGDLGRRLARVKSAAEAAASAARRG